MPLIPAARKDRALIEEMDSFTASDDVHLWWLGQSGFLLQWHSHRILLDPYLSDSLTKKYANTEKPHVRMSERVVDPIFLKGISVVTSSHNHTDHLDAETLIPILESNPDTRFVIPEANRDFVADRVKCGRDFPIGLNEGGNVKLGPFTLHGVPAKHNEIERDARGRCKFMGYVVEFGRWKVYHSGDTIWFDEMVGILKPFGVDLALLPINGNDPARGVAGNLDCREAVQLGRAISAKCVVPCHYDMFTFNTADVRDFEAEAQKRNQAYQVLVGGQRMELH